MKKRIFSIVTAILLAVAVPLSALGHSGRTDAKGGHKDNKNKSGLGPYHYHCGGYPPHLHDGGVCPYKGSASSANSSSNSSSSVSSSSGSSYANTPVIKATEAPKVIYASEITDQSVPEKIKIGEETTLKASVYPENAEDKEISWSSSDTNILKVSTTGALTAVGVGTAVITAKTSRGTAKEFTIIVEEIMAEKISVTTGETEILIGDESFVSCSFTPENTTNKTISWKSDNEAVVSVTDDGKIIGKGIGTATITATHKALTDSIIIEVKPIDVNSVNIILPDDTELDDEKNPRIKKGTMLSMKAVVEPENATYKNIKWSIDEDTLAEIDEEGVLTANSNGKIVVKAIAESGVYDEVEIEIYSNTGLYVAGFGGGITAVAIASFMILRKRKQDDE